MAILIISALNLVCLLALCVLVGLIVRKLPTVERHEIRYELVPPLPAGEPPPEVTATPQTPETEQQEDLHLHVGHSFFGNGFHR